MRDRLRCPRCREGRIQLVPDGMIGDVIHPGYHVAGTPLPMRWRPAPFGACNACEFCIEIRMPARPVQGKKSTKPARNRGLTRP